MRPEFSPISDSKCFGYRKVCAKLFKALRSDINASMKRATTFAIITMLVPAVATLAHATAITVTNINDNGPGSLH